MDQKVPTITEETITPSLQEKNTKKLKKYFGITGTIMSKKEWLTGGIDGGNPSATARCRTT
jgi:hypothetical protein